MKSGGSIRRMWRVCVLALADLRHEWRMSLCLVLAVAAIAAPLLLFFGLKNGTVQTLRKRLLDNPVSLEILPLTERLLDVAWFDVWRSDSRVAFVTPHTRKLSAQADLRPAGKDSPQSRVDLQPTLPGDLLLTRYGAPVPEKDQCVLTDRAAALLGVKAGDSVTVLVSRERATVKGSRDFSVLAVLPPRAGQLPAVYIPLAQLEAMEDFKDGRAVPAFDWPGSDPLAHAVLPSLLLFASVPLDPAQQALLLQNTGFGKLEPLDARLVAEQGFSGSGYHLKSVGGPATEQNIGALRDKLRGRRTLFAAGPGRVRLHIVDARGQDLAPVLEIHPATALDAPLPGYALPQGFDFEEWSVLNRRPALRHFLVSPATLATLPLDRDSGCQVRATYSDGSLERSVSFLAYFTAAPDVAEGLALAPMALFGVLNLLEQRPLVMGESKRGQETFLLGRRGYSGFRMYAASLEEVAPLAEALEAEGIRANTRADRIDEVLRLDKYLNLLFWLIAAASFVGGAACLLASIYANVERKRRDLAVLRLLGVHGAPLALFPLASSVTLTMSGMALSLGLFQMLSLLINYCFREHLEQGERFCSLDPMQQAAAVGLALLIALFAGLAASRRLALINPSEALRDE